MERMQPAGEEPDLFRRRAGHVCMFTALMWSHHEPLADQCTVCCCRELLLPCSSTRCRSWIFHRDCIFDKSRLQALLRLLEPRTLRLKGVFRVSSKTWVAISAAPAAAAAASLADAAPSSQPAAAQLSEIAYRRDSRAEVIIDVAAAASSSCPAAPDVSLTAGCLEQQAAQLGLEEGGGMERQVAAALRQAAAGDWGGLEALLQQTLAS